MAAPTDLYQAIYPFQAENAAELELAEGDIIRVFNKEGGEWWEGQLADGRVGLFPANRVVEFYEETGSTQPPSGHADPNAAYYAQQQHGYAQGEGGQDAPPLPALPAFPAQYQAMASPRSAHAQEQEHKQRPDLRAPFAPVPPTSEPKQANGAAKKDNSFLPPKPVPITRFGYWASMMSLFAAPVVGALGLGSIIWAAKESKYGLMYGICGLYSIVISVLMVLYEKYRGFSRTSERFPVRCLVYLGLSVFMFFSTPTIFGGILVVCVAGVNLVAAWLGEEYEAPSHREPEVHPNELPSRPDQSICDRFRVWILLMKEQSQLGLILFVSLYVSANVVIFFVFLAEWIDKNRNATPDMKLSYWAPLAKGFGNMLNFNCSLLLVPVLRTIIRWLYNVSTAGEGLFNRLVRGLLTFVPVDLAIAFHKLIAKVVVFASFGHVVMHLINFVLAETNTVSRFGWWPWISGGFITTFMLFIYSAAAPIVREGHFEIFWYNHHFFVGFFFMLLLHGAGGWGPNFWKWVLGPGLLYIIERLLRMYRARQPVVLLSVTNMKPNVFALEFAKEGVLASEYKEGQYMFICCPRLSKIQWHPFTISSAPQEKSVTLHIRKQKPGSWTYELSQYLSAMGPASAVYYEFTRQTVKGVVPGKILGPDGNPIFQIDGPHSAPTQHVSEYDHVMIIGAGIGVTPVASTLKSVTMHKWKYYMGKCHPDHAYFFWACSHSEIDSFRWLIRTIKDAEDEVYDMRAKTPKDMSQKRFEFHIFVSSVPKGQKPIDVVVDDEVGFWGVPKPADYLDKVRAPFSEADLYRAMMCPEPHSVFGDIHIWAGRPRWSERFAAVAAAHPSGDIGVAFCGNPGIANDLQTCCYKYSSLEERRFFKLHKENF